MRPFIIKSILFLLIAIIYFVVMATFNFYIISNSDPEIKPTTVLIVGDSHTQTALDPSMFKSATNISQTAEPYVLTFWKLKRILSSFQADTVLIGFGHQNITAFNDRKFSNRFWSSEMFKRSYSIQDFKTLDSLEVDYMEYYRVMWKYVCVYPHKDHYKFIGSYSNSDNSDLSDVNEAIERHYYYNEKQAGLSETAISYLDSIIDLCQNNGSTPILANHPVSKPYYELIPPEIKASYEAIKVKLKNKGIMIIDKSSDFYPDSFYLNADHLNSKGAFKFTTEILKDMKRKKPWQNMK